MEIGLCIIVPPVVVVSIIPRPRTQFYIWNLTVSCELEQTVLEVFLCSSDKSNGGISALCCERSHGFLNLHLESQSHPSIPRFVNIVLIGNAVLRPLLQLHRISKCIRICLILGFYFAFPV